MKKLKQLGQVLVEVSEHYDKNEGNKESLKTQIIQLLAAIDKNMKEQNAR